MNLKPAIHSAAVKFSLALLLFWTTGGRLVAYPDMRFDVVTFCCNCGTTILCQPQFDALNFPSPNGHYIAMGTDAYRSNLLANGNLLAIYYNAFDSDYSTNIPAAQEVAAIDAYAVSQFTTTGPKPNWIVLNELSGSLWPSSQTYRTWVDNVVHSLATAYGYSVIVYAPFPNPGNNSADWAAVQSDAYVAVENYLSGQEIAAQNFSVDWCQGVYQSSIASYNAVGVPPTRLILGEHFGQTLANTGYGRSGVSSNDWISAIYARSQAALNANFAGFIGYDWGGDPLGVSQNEMIQDENVYAANPLPATGALTLPYPALQPQNQIAPPGADVTFSVVPAGDAPVTYQWNFNGRMLAGSTLNTLTITNIVPTNGGTYAILLSNAVGSAWSSNAVLTVQVPPPIAFEPFANATANGGTAYSPATALIGQTNVQGQMWFQAGPSSALTNQPLILAGGLDVPGLAFSSGNSAGFGGNGGMAARFQIITNGTGVTSGPIYFSFALKLTNITGLSSSGVFWAGFNNTAGAQTTTPNVVATRIYTRAAGHGFNLGLSKASGTATDWQWDTTVHTNDEVIFLVGSYTFSSDPDDFCQLWIDPTASSFGTATAPSATLTATTGPDVTSEVIKSFLLMNRDPTEPAGGIIDELRIGTTWASVTPPSGALPTLSISQNAGRAVIWWPTNAVGFSLYSATSLSSTNGWAPVALPVYTIGGYFTVTNSFPGAEYFRLQHP